LISQRTNLQPVRGRGAYRQGLRRRP
jgi:hypothetical protein